MTDYFYSIYARLRTETTSPADLGKRFMQTLSDAANESPQIGEWLLMPRPFARDSLTFSEAFGDIRKFVEDNVATVDMQPDIDEGYFLNARNMRGISGDSIGLSASVGGKFDANLDFVVGFTSIPSDLSVVSYPLFKKVFSLFIAQWPVIWANAEVSWRDYEKTTSAPGVPPHPYSRYSVPWISYLSAPLIEGFEPSPDIQTERTPEGGLVMIATENRLDPTNPEEMRRSRQIAEIMIARAGDP